MSDYAPILIFLRWPSELGLVLILAAVGGVAVKNPEPGI